MTSLKTKKKIIAIIGASYLQLPLVKKAIEMGYETICFAYEKGAVCKKYCTYFYPISIIEREEILKECEKHSIDAVCTIASDLAVLTVNYVAAELNLIGNSLFSSSISTDKFKMKKAFTKANIPVAKNLNVSSISELQKVDYLNFPVIVKPVDRSGSAGLSIVIVQSKLKVAIEKAMNESILKKVIVEEFISGIEVSVESISFKGKHSILAITDKVTTGAPHFVELEHHQPSLLNKELQSEIKSLTLQALNSLEIEYGASHTELIIDENNNRVYLNEVGARMGGDFIGSHLVELTTGFDYVKATINVSLGLFEKPMIKNKNYAGVIFFSKENVERTNSLLLEKSVIKKEIIGNLKKKTTKSSDRFGYAIYKSTKRI